MRTRGFGPGMRPGNGPDAEPVREVCRAQASPKVKVCIEKAMAAAHGRANVAVALPVEKKLDPSEFGALPAGFVAPPRTITDITAILDAEKPDPALLQKLKTAADAAPPAGAAGRDLAWFYYTRGNARAQLGRLNDAMEDGNKAVEIGRGAGDANLMGRLQQFAGLQYAFAGNPKQSLTIFESQIRGSNVKGAKGQLFGGYRQISSLLLQMGDIEQAEAYLRRSQALLQEARTSGFPGWRTSYATYGQSWEADIEFNRAIILEARGQFRDAETAYRQAELRRRSIHQAHSGAEERAARKPVAAIHRQLDPQSGAHESQAGAARRGGSRRPQGTGFAPAGPRKIQPGYAKILMGLAGVLVEQGRYGEAERLAHVSLEINREVGIAENSHATANLRLSLGSMLVLQRKTKEAAAVYAELDKGIAKWEPRQREKFDLNGSRISALYASGQVEAGLAAAQALLKREISRLGEKHFDTAIARGTIATGFMRAGKDADAVREFKHRHSRLDGCGAGECRSTMTLPSSRRAGCGCRMWSRPTCASSPEIKKTAATASPSKPSGLPMPSAVSPCSRHWQLPARAWWQRIPRSLSSSATSRIFPSRSMRSSARSTTCCRWPPPSARKTASGRSTRRSTSCAPIGTRHVPKSPAASRPMPI